MKPCLALTLGGLLSQAAEAAQCTASPSLWPEAGSGLWMAGLALMAGIALRRVR